MKKTIVHLCADRKDGLRGTRERLLIKVKAMPCSTFTGVRQGDDGVMYLGNAGRTHQIRVTP